MNGSMYWLDVTGLKRLLRGPTASTEALDEKLRAAVETVERRLHKLHNPQCVCGAEEEARRDRRDLRRMCREEEGDNGDDDGEDLPNEDCSDGGSCEPEHSGSCPCWEPNSRSAHSLNPDVDYEDVFNLGLDRDRRLRYRHPGVGHSAHARHQDDMRELNGALYGLREAQQLNQVTGTPSKMSLEELQAEAAAYLERWPQALIARGLPPLDVSDCVTRWDYTMALSRAQHLELSPYEWMRFAFSLAAETGHAHRDAKARGV